MIDKFLTVCVYIFATIFTFAATLGILVFKYGFIALALYIVYRIIMHFFGG